MFTTEIDINSIAVTTSGLVVLTTTTMAIIGFSIKKLFHIIKG